MGIISDTEAGKTTGLKIVLISANGQESEYGLRSLAACLLRDAHNVLVVHVLPHLHAGLGRLTEKDLESVLPLCADADLIGVSYLSNFRANARLIERTLKPIKKDSCRIVAGGIHPSVWPEDALNDFDYVIRGEGETAMREFAQRHMRGESLDDLENLGYRRNGQTILNPVRPLIRDINSLPFPLLEYGRVYFRPNGGPLAPLSQENVREYFWTGETEREGELPYYSIHTSRGCPHRCTFCVNEALGHLYRDHHPKRIPIRRQSNERVIRELEWVRKEFPFVGKVLFTDDDFTARPPGELRELCDIYRERIGLPFDCYVSAPTVSGEKIDALIRAGLRTVSLGVQSGSDRTNFEIYNRKIARKTNSKAIATISKRLDLLDPRIPFKVHYIIKNPWETRKDVVETARMICGLPWRAYVILFSLNYFPGTKIFDRALAERVIENVDDDVEDYDGWTGRHLTLDRKTGRPSPSALLPLLAVQHIRFLPVGLRALVLALLGNPIGYRLLGAWRFSGKIRRIVEFLAKTHVACRAVFRKPGPQAYSERHLS